VSDRELQGAARGGGSRHRAREIALQALYAIDLGSRTHPGREPLDPEQEFDESHGSRVGEPEAEADRVFARIVQSFDVPTSAAEFARELVRAVIARREEIDDRIGLHTRNWRISRMAVVDRNVLRLAVYELQHTDTPVAVVIDEAVDLARRFASDSSPPFVNGVLDAVAREVRAA